MRMGVGAENTKAKTVPILQKPFMGQGKMSQPNASTGRKIKEQGK